MSYTYSYTKQFLESQYKLLNKPLTLTDSINGIIANDKDLYPYQPSLDRVKFSKILGKVNVQIRKYNSHNFNSQISNQIIQQVLKLESYKASIVHEKLSKINSILNPLLISLQYISGNHTVNNHGISSKLEEFKLLIEELPDSKYLLLEVDASSDEEIESEEEVEGGEKDNESGILIQDDQPVIQLDKVSVGKGKRTLKRQLLNQVKEHQQNKLESHRVLLEQYDTLRSNLTQAYDSLVYKYEKLQYLKNLRDNLRNIIGDVKEKRDIDGSTNSRLGIYDSDEEDNGTLQIRNQTDDIEYSNESLVHEINKFRVLIEKTTYNFNRSNDDSSITLNNHNNDNLRSVISSVNNEIE
ncbi:kinetochore Sim4 complex subunit Fta4 [Scheffersomyces amazonensis]|uniref:kinetochore Sim4 complex subunit Fta4 n=1 Tax=Scheffersomyces amazonensis TaxID=1078765 RepID=UPI00315D7449